MENLLSTRVTNYFNGPLKQRLKYKDIFDSEIPLNDKEIILISNYKNSELINK